MVRSEHARAIEEAKKAGLDEADFRPFRFHDMRHRHAVDWLKAGRSIYDLQQRLGHTSIRTTEIYLTFLTPEEKRAVMFGVQQGSLKESQV
jgi:integrase/recombinase XerD